MSWDQTGFDLVYAITGNPFLDSLMFYLAELLVVSVPLVLVYLWFQGREGKRDSLLAFSSTVLGLGVSYAMGLIYFHQNPSAVFDTIVAFDPENAFPSQHAAVIFSAAWPLFWRERKNLGYLVLVAAVATGFARVYIGEHWPVDILGSIIASSIGFGIVYFAEDYLWPVIDPAVEFGEKVEGKTRVL